MEITQSYMQYTYSRTKSEISSLNIWLLAGYVLTSHILTVWSSEEDIKTAFSLSKVMYRQNNFINFKQIPNLPKNITTIFSVYMSRPFHAFLFILLCNGLLIQSENRFTWTNSHTTIVFIQPVYIDSHLQNLEIYTLLYYTFSYPINSLYCLCVFIYRV